MSMLCPSVSPSRHALARFGDVLAAAADVTDASRLQRLVTQVTDDFKRIDLLVNDAGRLSSGEFAHQGSERIEEVICQP